MFGWNDRDWSYTPYQEGVIVVHEAPHALLGLDGKLMNCLVECAPGIATLGIVADHLYDAEHEPEWLQSEISHRICRLRKHLIGGPISIRTIRRKMMRHLGGGNLVGWRLDGFRDIPVSEIWNTHT